MVSSEDDFVSSFMPSVEFYMAAPQRYNNLKLTACSLDAFYKQKCVCGCVLFGTEAERVRNEDVGARSRYIGHG